MKVIFRKGRLSGHCAPRMIFWRLLWLPSPVTALALGALLMTGGMETGTARAQDTPEDKQAHAGDGVPETKDPVPSAAGEPAASGKAEERRSQSEGEEELPAEFQPEQVIPFDQSRVELPDWQAEERAEILQQSRPANQGGGLFPPQIWPVQPAPALGPLVLRHNHDASATPGLEGGEGREPPAGILSPALLDQYFVRKPDGVFLDPQHLLPERERREMESRVRRWLNVESPFRTTVLLFGRGQKLPPEVDAEAVMRKWSGGAPDMLLVFYYFKEPERTKAIFSPGATRRFAEAQLTAAMSAAIRESSRADGGLEQLERLCYKTTVRLHRLAQSRPPNGARSPQPLARTVRNWIRGTAGLAVLAAAVLILRKRRQRRAKAGPGPVFLPEQDLQARLGAPHCGGFSAVLSFASRKNV